MMNIWSKFHQNLS